MKIIQMRNKMKSRQYVFSASCWLRGSMLLSSRILHVVLPRLPVGLV